MTDRAAIVGALREIATLLELRGDNKFKARAFARGATALDASTEPIEKLVDGGRLTDLPGIGAALARQIEDLHRTGKSELLEELRAALPPGVLELSQVEGIGLAAIKALHDELGIASVDDLRRAAEEGRVRVVKGFGAKKEAKILEAIEEHVARVARGPVVELHEGLRLGAELEREYAGIAGVKSVYLAGSVARSQELSRELSIVACAETPAAVVATIADSQRVASIDERTDASVHARLADGTRLGVVVCTAEHLPTVLARELGAPAHWDALVARAAARGLRLTGEGLFEGERRIALESEAALYAKLGLTHVPAELREGQGEIEDAARGESWDDLVTEADVVGFVHCHTTWSDGKGTIEEMARAAEARGASFITITDHSSAAFYASGLDVERLQRQWDEIDRVQENVKIKILKGTEADILADGALDWPDAILERLDVVIASIHNRHHQDETKMTERVLRAMRHPVFKIWGHPLGRLVTSRPPIALRMEEVLDAIASSRSAIEINGDPHRLDLEPRWVRAARERGIPFTLSVDAHSLRELENVRYAVGLARRAGVRRREVLNVRPDFAKAVRPSS